MSFCDACAPKPLAYQIEFTNSDNQSHIPIIVRHLDSKGMLLNHDSTSILMKEEAVKGLYDYCADHLDLEAIRFRIKAATWKPINEVFDSLENRWIDTVINDELVHFHYQPIIDGDKKVYAYEMLARFTGEKGEPVSPYEAFKSARSRNRTYALDKVCRINAVKNASVVSEKVFINFIPTSIYSPEHCLKTTVALAHNMGIAPSRLVFEVVETEKVTDMDHLKRILNYYREKGFSYALDDVGEGYNTIDTIRELKPHYMKLDMKFVQGVANDQIKQQAALSILEAAQSVNSIALAEGIEEPEDFEWLKAAGFELFQGYLFGKPAPIKAS